MESEGAVSVMEIRPMPAEVRGKRVKLCDFKLKKGYCSKKDSCTFAHSEEEKKAWEAYSRFTNFRGKDQMLKKENTGWTPCVAEESIDHSSPSVEQQSPSIRDPMTAENYKKKFIELINAEKEDHKGELKQRCKGKYQYDFVGYNCPYEGDRKSDKYAIYGKLSGLSCEDFAYVKQASSSVTLHSEKIKARADIYFSTNLQCQYNMYLAFLYKEDNLCSSCTVEVEFNLKESYFKDLVSSVQKLNIVSRLLPSLETFQNNSFDVEEEDLSACKKLCSEEQFEALKVIINTAPNSPPILLTGSFGTGKSTLLAICAAHLLSKSSEKPIRILVCTQQKISADIFWRLYTNINMKGKKNENIFVIRNMAYSFSEIRHHTSEDFKKIFSKTQSLLVITTCLTAPRLCYLPPGFFSHIFIDEGSHMREPEAIAPLQFATEDTKIVIAGDSNQVGPANLVRGKVATANLLNISLLQRLEKVYSSNADCHIMAKLFYNYRCHPDILKMLSDLFYSSSLKWNELNSIPGTHHKYRFPLVFICTEIDSQVKSEIQQQKEAKVIAEVVIDLAQPSTPAWNTDMPMENFFITTPCENQIGNLKKEFNNSKCPDMRTLFQGQQYQAVILSTTEPVHLDGSTLDSTKSFCDPYVFNTAVSRAKSLVVAVGNPFLLLNIEKSITHYGDKHNTKCWSTFIKLCIEKNTFEFHASLSLKEPEKHTKLEKIKELIADNLKLENLKEEYLKLQKKLKELEEKNLKLKEENLKLREENSKLQEQNSIIQNENSNLQQKNARKINKEELENQTPSPPETRQPIQQTPTKGESKHIVLNDKEIVIDRRGRLSNIVNKKLLGKSGFAIVYHVFDTKREENYALKVIQCKPGREKYEREVNFLQTLKHERIVTYVDHWDCDDDEGWWSESSQEPRGSHRYLFILTELCKKETLCRWLENNSGNNERSRKDVSTYFTQITDGLIFIHGEGYMHRDLKPSNIFFSLTGNGLKIGDFGLVKDESSKSGDGEKKEERNKIARREHEIYIAISSQNMDSKSTYKGYGTPYYVSPEQQDMEQVDSKTDIYALGVILFELYYPTTDKRSPKILASLTRKKEFPPNFENYFPNVHSSILKMIDHDPSKRPTAGEVKDLLKNNTESSGASEVESSSEFISICDISRCSL